MSTVIQPWVALMPRAERVSLVRAAYDCIEQFGGHSPITRAIRQAVLTADVLDNGDRQLIGGGELLIHFDKFIGALDLIPPTATAAVHRVAMALEIYAPARGDGWDEGAIRECWAALRRAIDDRRARDDPEAVRAAMRRQAGHKAAATKAAQARLGLPAALAADRPDPKPLVDVLNDDQADQAADQADQADPTRGAVGDEV